MMACTSPLPIARSTPLRICLPPTSACRFLICKNGIASLLLASVRSGVLAVPVIGMRQTADAGIGGGLEIGILDAGSDGDLSGIGIVDEVDAAPGRDAEIAQIARAGVDELVRLGSCGRADDVARA